MKLGEFKRVFQAARNGDREARERLGEHALGIALAVARRNMQAIDRRMLESGDIQQSVVGCLFMKLPRLSFSEEAELAAWLREVASRKLQQKRRDALRQKRDERRNESYPTAGVQDAMGETTDQIVNRMYVDELLGKLPPEEELILRLHEQAGFTFAEIARRLDIRGADAARKRCARALVKLARMIAPEAAA